MIRKLAVLAVGLAAVCLASPGYSADLVIEVTEAPGTVAVTGDWDGLFIGGFAGYAGGSISDPGVIDISGWLLGVNAGANFTLTEGVVAGIVGDIAWTNIADDEMLLPPSSFDVNWAGSLRGRVGYNAGAFLPYLTAGVAFANVTLTDILGTEVTNGHVGWTIGAGVDFKATEDLSVDLSYRYSDYGAAEYVTTDWDFATHQISVGLNWHF